MHALPRGRTVGVHRAPSPESGIPLCLPYLRAWLCRELGSAFRWPTSVEASVMAPPSFLCHIYLQSLNNSRGRCSAAPLSLSVAVCVSAISAGCARVRADPFKSSATWDDVHACMSVCSPVRVKYRHIYETREMPCGLDHLLFIWRMILLVLVMTHAACRTLLFACVAKDVIISREFDEFRTNTHYLQIMCHVAAFKQSLSCCLELGCTRYSLPE